MNLISDVMTVYRNYGYESKVIVVSVRNPLHVMDAVMIGADIVTIQFKVIEQLAKHSLITNVVAQFLTDWETRKKKSISLYTDGKVSHELIYFY
jgi:transaldolase